jgi:glycosyltransferase involved in cell wall biosynthesis
MLVLDVSNSFILGQMYLIAIHVPIYVCGNTHLLATDWKRSLELLRDSLQERYGNIYVVAPSLTASEQTDQALEEVNQREGIITAPSFPLNTRARHYWLHYREQWMRDVGRLAIGAKVVHAGFDDCYRPISWLGFQIGARYDKPTVFVQDVDHVSKIEDGMALTPLARRPERFIYKSIYEYRCRQGVKQACLSLLKGNDLIKRYGPFARNPHTFHDTSYLTREIVDPQDVALRNQNAMGGRPLRFVFCGRVVEGKGLDHSITAIARARRMGANVSLDIIGDGIERANLEGLASGLEVQQFVHFLGHRPYGAELLRELSSYDALLFTPMFEDTARMIFDGYAAGLPLIGYATPYIEERAAEDRTAITSPLHDIDALARTLYRVDQNRSLLSDLMPHVNAAAQYHSADAWYRRRADLTFEAVANYRNRTAA